MPDKVSSLNPALIEFERITVMRGDTLALDDVSLKIGAGEHVAIIGPNGCGKSTFIKAITRECYPLARDESSLKILGGERWNVFELRSMLGIVSSDLMTVCIRDMTGMDMVLSGFFSRSIHSSGVKRLMNLLGSYVGKLAMARTPPVRASRTTTAPSLPASRSKAGES
jgi:ABC-type molybdenum transport system ATPase subunit/photorepair protein PhrA